MSQPQDASAAAPILLCGILGGLLGGLTCFAWLAPAATSFIAVKWVRNLRGPESTGLLRAGVAAAFISALLVATFGTAVYLYRHGDSMGDIPLGPMAVLFAGGGGFAGLVTGLLGAIISTPRRPRGTGHPSLRGGSVGSATRFLHPTHPPTPAPAPAALQPVRAQVAVPVTPPAPVAPPSPPVAPPAPPEPELPPRSFARPTAPPEEPVLDVQPEDLATQASEGDAWGDD